MLGITHFLSRRSLSRFLILYLALSLSLSQCRAVVQGLTAAAVQRLISSSTHKPTSTIPRPQ